MFFAKKQHKLSPLEQTLGQLLADYFSQNIEDVRAWISVKDKTLSITFPFVNKSQWQTIEEYLLEKLEPALLSGRRIEFSSCVASGQTSRPHLTNIRNIIAVASGKGGVGKSTTSVNLAFALMREGAKVGLLDADIYGPSIPIMLGNTEAHPTTLDNKHMQPLEAFNMVANSIGYLVAPEDAAIWRGPMVSRAVTQLLNETLWPVLDYLIVDLPPGTGDIQLTMAQQVPLTAAVVVTTPQDLALADAQKGISMFNKVDVPVLGLVENMSYYQCTNCGHRDYIFAKDGGAALAQHCDLPLLGALPLDINIREHADNGTPLLISEPDSDLSAAYLEMARAVSMQLALTVAPEASSNKHIKGDPIAVAPGS
jgi:ATP-binding protein involved in chromosome partitioning